MWVAKPKPKPKPEPKPERSWKRAYLNAWKADPGTGVIIHAMIALTLAIVLIAIIIIH